MPGNRLRPGAHIDPDTGAVTFVVADEPGREPVRVWFHLADFGADPRFHRDGLMWTARIPRPPVNRLEYLLEFQFAAGSGSVEGSGMILDPANPRRVRGVFGEHSLLEWPAYREPWWLAVARATAAQDRHDELAAEARRAQRTSRGAARPRELGEVPATAATPPQRSSRPATAALRVGHGWAPSTAVVAAEGVASVRLGRTALGATDARRQRSPHHLAEEPTQDAGLVVDERAAVVVTGRLHLPPDSTPAEPLPLLVVHDGPEYLHLGRLADYLSVLARIDPQLRVRVLALQPVDRDRCYSASPAYARALVREMLPRVRSTVRVAGPVVGVGASLGALSLMHAAVTYPGSFGGLFCQSGSFFLPRTDAQERSYRFYNRIVRFVETLDTDPDRLAGLHVAMTCGSGEENLANNRQLARRLARSGVDVTLLENPDGHNYTGWRDALDPPLRRLLGVLWGGRQATVDQ